MGVRGTLGETLRQMHAPAETIAAIATSLRFNADALSGPPDRREISARWLSGTFLTGLTSTILMGVCVDGRPRWPRDARDAARNRLRP